jgi:phospholipase A1
LTVRHSLRSPRPADKEGSVELEWIPRPSATKRLRPWATCASPSFFNGYGNGLLDYSRRRTVLSIGLSLVDW